MPDTYTENPKELQNELQITSGFRIITKSEEIIITIIIVFKDVGQF